MKRTTLELTENELRHIGYALNYATRHDVDDHIQQYNYKDLEHGILQRLKNQLHKADETLHPRFEEGQTLFAKRNNHSFASDYNSQETYEVLRRTKSFVWLRKRCSDEPIMKRKISFNNVYGESVSVGWTSLNP
tara:strand:- start:342 stop:743 length:402 start_codon:yes stop_codon:yes gene_type:complete